MRIKRRYYWLVFCLLWFPFSGIYAQKDSMNVGKRVLAAEPARPTLRQPLSERWSEIKDAREYQYGHDVEPPSGLIDELWQRFLAWLFEFLYSTDTRKSREWVQILFITAVVVFVLYKFMGMDKMGLFQRKSKRSTLPYSLMQEDIHAIDFREAIDQAVHQHNYRLAVRLLYLQTLKTMADRQLISWQINKTNRTYVYEVNQPGLRPTFEHLTSLFEYVWYGDFPVTEERYREIQQEFNEFRV